jgi:signal peptidase I
MKKVLLSIINVLSIAIIIFSIFILLTVVMTGTDEAPDFLGYSVFNVLTGSMEPSIPAGSLIVTHRTEPAEIQVGDVITFYSRDPALNGATNTHRVVGVERNGSDYVYRTRGDANAVDDDYPTRSTDLIGVVIFSSLLLGKTVHLLSNPLIFFPLLIVPLVVLLLANLWSTISMARKMAKEEEEAAIREILERRRNEAENAKPSDE